MIQTLIRSSLDTASADRPLPVNVSRYWRTQRVMGKCEIRSRFRKKLYNGINRDTSQ